MLLDIAYYGDPILRKKAEPIGEITTEIRQLAHDMIETMQHLNGIGLSGPQVKKLLRIFVTCLEKEDDVTGEMIIGEPRIFINPSLKDPSPALVEAFEGCLSIPKLRGAVIRPLQVTLEATDLEGNQISERLHGYVARMMMHENDHLNGVLYIDRMNRKNRDKLEPYLKEIKKRGANF